MGSFNLFAEFLRNFDRLVQQGENPNNYDASVNGQNLSERPFVKQTDKYDRNPCKNNTNDS